MKGLFTGLSTGLRFGALFGRSFTFRMGCFLTNLSRRLRSFLVSLNFIGMGDTI